MSAYDPRQHRPATPPQWQQQQQQPQREWQGPQFQPARPEFDPRAPYQPRHDPPGRQPRKGGYAGWAAVGAAVLVVLVAAVVFVQHRRAPQTCAQQYAGWKSGTGAPEAAAIGSDSSALTAAGKAEDVKTMDAALVKLGADADADKSHPMPACADPAGYWPQILSAMQAAGDNASATPGLGGLLTAEAPLKPVKGLESKLHDELARTTAVSS